MLTFTTSSFCGMDMPLCQKPSMCTEISSETTSFAVFGRHMKSCRFSWAMGLLGLLQRSVHRAQASEASASAPSSFSRQTAAASWSRSSSSSKRAAQDARQVAHSSWQWPGSKNSRMSRNRWGDSNPVLPPGLCRSELKKSRLQLPSTTVSSLAVNASALSIMSSELSHLPYLCLGSHSRSNTACTPNSSILLCPDPARKLSAMSWTSKMARSQMSQPEIS
mmetsp:Transcript_45565/g.102894  ORF Transcript_45565/g.102894 Transcript_45565/m.102894 type:complete len:221 (+) Transcript_45565:340-1002(+)